MDGWGWLEPRTTEELWARQFGGGFGGGDNDGDDDNDGGGGRGGGDRNGTDGRPWDRDGDGGGRGRFGGGPGNNFRFQAAKSIRTSTIILSVFNVVAAFATAVGILWDGYATAKRNNPKFSFRASAFSCIRSPETFPLVLSCGIVIQGIVFAVAQSTGLRGMLVLGCTITSQMMLPAVFIVPYIQLVFGLEVVIRSLQRKVPFPPRGKWNVTICIAIVGTLLLVTYLVTHFIRPPNFCFASLFWFLQRYRRGALILFSLIAVVLLASTVIIFLKLHRNASIDSVERVAASRMVFYLSLGFISSALVIPFFVDVSFFTKRGSSPSALQLSMVAAVVANISGLMTGGLHLFLRSTTLATIGPRGKSWKDEEEDRENFKRGIRRWRPEDGDGDDGGEGSYKGPSQGGIRRMNTVDSYESYGDKEGYELEDKGYWGDEDKGYWGDEEVNPLRSHAVFPANTSTALRSPEPPRQAPNHAPKSSYSLFPGSINTVSSAKPPKPQSRLPAAVYDPEAKETMAAPSMLKPPAPVHGFRHRRDSSLASHTTVQIGLRLSNVEDMPPVDPKYLANTNKEVHNLECPHVMAKMANGVTPKRPSPLMNVMMRSADGSDDGTSTLNSEDASTVHDGTAPTTTHEEAGECKICTLAPAVYQPPGAAKPAPKTKVTSPKGVGFSIPPSRANSSKAREAPPPRPIEQTVPVGKADWI